MRRGKQIRRGVVESSDGTQFKGRRNRKKRLRMKRKAQAIKDRMASNEYFDRKEVLGL